MCPPPKGNQPQQNVDKQMHCILVAASNPFPLPTPVYRPKMQKLDQSENIESQADSRLSDAETVAKSFPLVLICRSAFSFCMILWFSLLCNSLFFSFYLQCSVSLSVICPKQLPKLRAIYNAVMMEIFLIFSIEPVQVVDKKHLHLLEYFIY